MKIAFYTLGCKVNQYETQALEQMFTQRGHELVPFEGAADAYIVNTCTVTAVSDKKSRQVIRRARKDNPDAVIAVCGCYQAMPSDFSVWITLGDGQVITPCLTPQAGNIGAAVLFDYQAERIPGSAFFDLLESLS